MAVLVSYGPYTTLDATTGALAATTFGTRAITIAIAKVSYFGPLGILSVFLKGMLCNWLVCLALFLSLAADDVIGKMVGVWFPTMAFVVSGFEHGVANMYFIPAGIITNMIANGSANPTILNWGTMWTNNIIWSTLGNIVGGAVFMAVIYYYCYRTEICALYKTT
jgi:formate/nitrite transporter